MSLYILERNAQIFTWTSPDNTCSATFLVTPMLRAIAAGKLPYTEVEAPIDPEWAERWCIQRDLDFSYLHSLTEEQIEVSVLGVSMLDDTTLLIDGSHRYMARYLRRRPSIVYHIVPADAWIPYAYIQGKLNEGKAS